MTVGAELHKTLGMLKTASGQLQSFATDTNHGPTKQLYSDASKQIDRIVGDLSSRVNYVEGQEPQFKMSSMAQEATDNQ